MNDPGAWIGLEVDAPREWLESDLLAEVAYDEVAQEWLDERGEAFEQEISIIGDDESSALAELRASGFTIADEDIVRVFSSDDDGKQRWHFVTKGFVTDATPRGVFAHWRESFDIVDHQPGRPLRSWVRAGGRRSGVARSGLRRCARRRW